MAQITKNFIHKTKAVDGSWEILYPRTTATQVLTTDDQKFVSNTQITTWDGKATVESVATALKTAKDYADASVNALIDAAPEQLNTLNELAIAIQQADTELDGLLGVVGSKASAADVKTHTDDKVAHVTAAERKVWDDKASTAVASTTANGLMASADKVKLDGVAVGANNYALPAATTSVLGGIKTGANIDNTAGTISIKDASTSVKGVVMLNDTLTSASTTEALTAAKGKALSELVATKANAADIKNTVVGSTEPTGAATGSFWYEVVA